MKAILSKKDSERRQFVLAGDMWRVVMAISLPLAVYNGFNHLFSFVDTMMASHISSEVVSAIAYLSQIKTMLAAIGAGLAVGGGIIVARYYGAGDIKNAKKYVNTVLFLSIGIGLTLLIVMLPFITPILRIANTPEDLISAGSSYFKVEILMIITIFINNVYIAVEKAKGNTKKILYLNLMVIGVKLLLSALFVYVYNFGITMMAVATLIAHLLLTIIGLSNLMHRDNVFRLSFKELDLSMKTLKPIITLSLPIFFERFTFSLGKVIVNSMSAFYGSMVVGALGVSNNIAGIATSVANGFQDGEASIISQNLGNDSFERAIDAFKKTVIISLIIGGVGFLFTTTFIDGIISLFARGDVLFAGEIKNILKFEIYALITLTVTSAAMGLLYGFGYTRLSLIINFLRLFLFRIPPLYILQNFTSLGSESVGIAMMISNSMVGIIAITICFIVIQKMRKEGQYNLLIATE
ncbi:MATE family efflux transporter [Alkaliphilus peptidifermentans]|uniref:Putative efflux protein, MATE family n=1 Tax=Alkaliphilus peptidifermentans DSM 18978 TaxID=1120976 RepID=A0A1G5K120_9FIRM|nr:MATE family efflux transporter [Alkaliphilus peptidifermentans]SCY94382.1 putative efflux protein, MATE family [Alkaliphilus peptidifermentans DSM 18978]